MKEYTIDRSKWVCGGKRFSEKLGMTGMLNAKGRMCCLGQICEAEGVSHEAMRGIGNPCLIPRGFRQKVSWMISNETFGNSRQSSKMIRVNDNPDLNQKEREKKLKELALKVDIKLKFTGKLGVK